MASEEDEPTCPICGASMEWVDCWSMCEDGFVDEYEEDPINCDPGDTRPCGECNGQGGGMECTALPHSEEQMAAWRKQQPKGGQQ